MEKGFDMNDDLLVKYLAGEASTPEKERIRMWLEENEENRRYFGHFRTIWEESEVLALTGNADEDQAWDRFREKVILKPVQHAKVRSLRPFLRIAAIILLVCVAGGIAVSVFLKSREVRIVQLQSRGNTLTDTLPDGSVITLNRYSKLSYPSRFISSRKIVMEGEAFFEVTPDKNKPFIIQVNHVTVTVVGTSFNIKSGKGKTEVIVKTGVVQVTKDHDKVEVRAGEKVIAGQQNGLYKGINTNTIYDAYIDRNFVCQDTPLPELIDAVNNVYDAEIIIANKELQDLRISTTFPNQPLETILNVLRETYHIKIEREGQRILLK